MTDAPKALLTRAATFTTRAADDDGFTLEGYAAVFNTPTLIDSWEGRFEERILPRHDDMAVTSPFPLDRETILCAASTRTTKP